MEREKQLFFRPDGSFKIMQITDIQDTSPVNADTMRFINAVLDREKPDLVVFTGDQIKGYGTSLRGKDAGSRVEKVINEIIEPLTTRGIPFAVAFGNHDHQCIVPAEKQLSLYQKHKGCVSESMGEARGVANHVVPIYSGDGEKIVFNLYILDSHGGVGTGYDTVTADQIAWFKDEREKLREENKGEYVPSLLFQHIPVEEMYLVFDEFTKRTKNALPAYRKRKGKYYRLRPEFSDGQSFFGELPAVPDVNEGEFEAIKEKGDVLGIYVGHDHTNCFVGKVDGVDLGYAPCCGFSVYGPSVSRGVRVFELNEKQPRKYTTRMVFYKDIFGKKVEQKPLHWVIDRAPASFDVAMANVRKALLVLGVLTALITSVLLLIKKGRHH